VKNYRIGRVSTVAASVYQVLGGGAEGAGRERMTVADIGEFGLIERIAARLGSGPSVLLGPGDDAAVVAAADGRVVASTDVLVEGRHFRTDWASAAEIGHRAAAANLADIAAMGATPTALLLALCAPATLEVSWAEELAGGLAAEAAVAGASVVGGDISSSPTLTIAVTALGGLRGLAPVRRSGARPGDLVALAGRLGHAAAGLTMLARGLRSPEVIVDAYRRPIVPYHAGPDAARLGATAMIDVSDGLLADLGHIADASSVGIDLKRSALPVGPQVADVASALGVDPYAWILTGGDDHALVATFPPGARLTEDWQVIGAVQDGAEVTVDGEVHDGASTGWDHFHKPA
jgi:thiamine-monophosphate kinase